MKRWIARIRLATRRLSFVLLSLGKLAEAGLVAVLRPVEKAEIESRLAI